MSALQSKKTLLTFCLLLAGLVTIFGVSPVARSRADTASHDNWTVRCDKADPAKKAPPTCEIFQRLSMQKTGQRVAELAVGFLPGKGHDVARGVLVLPLGLLLTEDQHMKVDANKPNAFRVRYCTADGCLAFLDLNKSLLGTLRDGKKLLITGKAFTGQDFAITLELSGLDHALKKL